MTEGTVVTEGRFAPIDHAARIRVIQSMLARGGHGCDALFVTDVVDIRWLTGFTGSNAQVVVRRDDVALYTDGRYGERALAETAGSGARIVAESQRARLDERVDAELASATCVGVDDRSVSHAEWGRLASRFAVAPLASLVKVQRQVKDAAEVERIAAAAAAADAALAEVEPILMGTVDDPVTEADVRTELEYRMRLHGADDRSYDTIVASGPEHAARPHHEPTRRTIVDGDTVIIDVGGLVDGYHSDMTRSYVIGDATGEQADLYDLVDRSYRAGVDALRPGVDAAAVDAAARRVFVDAGYGDWYLHGTGHGVGLEIHESPFHSSASLEAIHAGNVVTIEPGLYRVGFGGLRIEDLFVVRDDGPQRLTHTVTHTPTR